jgi:hypothetical protein
MASIVRLSGTTRTPSICSAAATSLSLRRLASARLVPDSLRRGTTAQRDSPREVS